MHIRTQFPDIFLTTMLPALDDIVMNRYNRLPPQYSKVFRVLDSKRSIEQTSEIAGLGLFGEVAENGNVNFDEAVPGFSKTYIHSQFGLGFRISRVMVDDDRFAIIDKLASDLGRSAKETVELAVASHFNNGFNVAYPGPDGKPLFSKVHPLVKTGGVQSNTLATAADLDVNSIELALTDFRKMVDPSGKRIRVRPQKLIIPPELEFTASRIINSALTSNTPNHAINPLKHRVGTTSFEEIMVWEYLTDPDAWFISAEQSETELRFYWRERFNTVHDVHFESRSIMTAGWYRCSSGWSSFYGVYGSPGA